MVSTPRTFASNGEYFDILLAISGTRTRTIARRQTKNINCGTDCISYGACENLYNAQFTCDITQAAQGLSTMLRCIMPGDMTSPTFGLGMSESATATTFESEIFNSIKVRWSPINMRIVKFPCLERWQFACGSQYHVCGYDLALSATDHA